MDVSVLITYFLTHLNEKVKIAKLNSNDEVSREDQRSINPNLLLYNFHCGHFEDTRSKKQYTEFVMQPGIMC